MLGRYYDRFGLCGFFTVLYIFRLCRNRFSIIIVQIQRIHILGYLQVLQDTEHEFLNLSNENEPDCNTPETVKGETHRFPVVCNALRGSE